MKLRNPLMIRVVALLLSWVLRIWLGTLSIRVRSVGDDATPAHLNRRGIYLFWHEMLLIPTSHVGQGFSVLISQHADGELIAQIIRMLGGHTIRGSTTRAGMSALRGLMRAGRLQHLAITPGRPAGPAAGHAAGRGLPGEQDGHAADPGRGGGARLLARTGAGTAWPCRSRERVAIIVLGEPIEVSAELDRQGLDRELARAQAAQDDAQRRAESLVTARGITPTRVAGAVRPAGA